METEKLKFERKFFMEKAPAEMMRQYVRSQNFTSTDEVMTAMKDMFKGILQEVMECELADCVYGCNPLQGQGKSAL